MNKKIKNLFLAGAVLVGLAGVSVSCTDYSKDIDELRDENAALSKAVSELQEKLKSGSVIESVTPTSDGLVITVDGKSYTITNGQSGTSGKDGSDGKDGKDGKDGGYYTPGSDGYWYFHRDSTDTAGTKTDLKCLPSGAVKATLSEDGKTLTIADATTGEEIARLDLGGSASLVFIPQALVRGQEGLLYTDVYYTPLNGAGLNTKNEAWSPASFTAGTGYYALNEGHDDLYDHEFKCRYNSGIAEYHVNAKGVTLDDTFTYEFITKDLETRSGAVASSKDFGLKADFVSCEDGVLRVKVTVTGTEAYGEAVTVAALKATDGKTTVVSDYAAIWGDARYGFAISGYNNGHFFFRTDIDHNYTGTGADTDYPTGLIWGDSNTLESSDTYVAYNGSVDLKKKVFVYSRLDDSTLSAETLEAWGLTLDFSLVTGYKAGSPATDQADFASLADGVLTPKVYGTDGAAAIGRTPVVRVKLLRGTDVLAVAYIKVYITATPDMGSIVLTPTVDGNNRAKSQFTLANGGDKYYTTVAEVNTKLYNLFGGKAMFETLYGYENPTKYPVYVDAKDADLNVGTVAFEGVNTGTDATNVLVWTVTSAELRAAYKAAKAKGYALETLTWTGGFVHDLDGTHLYITLKAPVTDLSVFDGYDIPASGYSTGVEWNSNVTDFTFRAPTAGESSSDNCKLKVDLNSLFKVNAAGQIDIPSYLTTADANHNVYYFFCDDMAEDASGRPIKKTIGDVTVQFTFETRVSGHVVLKATEYDSRNQTVETADQWIAIIYNGGDEGGNRFEYLNNPLAQKLLNTGEMYALIGAKSYISEDPADARAESHEVPITFNGEDHFKANIVRPVDVAAKPGLEFKATATLGTAGSYVALPVVTVTDWLGNDVAGNTALTGYYGAGVAVDIANATCTRSGVETSLASAGITLTQVTAAKGVAANTDVTGAACVATKVYFSTDGGYIATDLALTAVGEYLTFQNTSSTSIGGDFEIHLPVNVSTVCGTITETVTITVKRN